MNAISFANRLIRDLNTKSITELTADSRQEIQDAINGSLQRLHDLAPLHSKTGVVSMFLDAPVTISLGVTQGSREITGYTFPAEKFYCTIRVNGDTIDNQITGETTLLHPHQGVTGSVNATIYGDAITIPETFEELTSDPIILETGTSLTNFRMDQWIEGGDSKKTGRPTIYWMEPNTRNQNPPVGPMVMRVSSYPDAIYRMEADAIMAPRRIEFSDLLTLHAVLPIRAEHVESYLLPLARAYLTESPLWEDKDSIARIQAKGEEAEARYALMIPKYQTTPDNRTRTKPGY